MRDVDSAVLRAVTQLSVLSGRLVRLLEDFSQRLSIENDASSAGAEQNGTMHADLLNAQELQKQVVAGHFALVRSMLRKQQGQWRMTMAQSMDQGVPGDQGQSQGARSPQCESSLVQSSQGQPNGQPFTGRQRQIIQLVVLGFDNRQIAQSLCIAEQTVKNHLYTIFGKAGVSKRRDLARQAYFRHDADSERSLDGDIPTNEGRTVPLARRATGD
jgi:ATP/maltotriose-dependent transcriptional regulator MalT